MKVFAVQFDIKWEDIHYNLEKIESLLAEQTGLEGSAVFLPEMFATGYTMQPSKVVSGISIATGWLKEFSYKHKCLIGGSLPVEDNGKFYNRFFVFANGEEVARYDKRHLFSNAGEDKIYSAGDKEVVFSFGEWKFKIAVCYDLRFPVWLRNKENYDILVIVANWPCKRNEVWQTLLTARAIENQSIVTGVNRTGTDGNGFEYCGNSLIIDEKGKILGNIKQDEGVLSVTLDKEKLIQFRQKFDTLKDADKFNIVL